MVQAVKLLRHRYSREQWPMPRWMARVQCLQVPPETPLLQLQAIAGSCCRLYTPLAWVVKEKVEAGDWEPLSRRDWLHKVVAKSQERAVCSFHCLTLSLPSFESLIRFQERICCGFPDTHFLKVQQRSPLPCLPCVHRSLVTTRWQSGVCCLTATWKPCTPSSSAHWAC